MRVIATAMERMCASCLPILMLFVLVAALGGRAFGQNPTNLYMGGVSYNPAGSPSFAVSGFYGRQVTSGTYAFTMLDALPIGKTFGTSISAGVAQRVATIAGHDIFVPSSLGITPSGTGVGWSWSTGAGSPYKFRATADGGGWWAMPNLRVLKASNGDYQGIFGVLVGWGK